MKKDHLTLAFPCKDVSGIKNQFHDSESVPWIYLGQDFFKRRLIEQKLGEGFERIDISRLLDEVSNDIRLEHVQWIDDLNRRYGKNIEWWFGTISSRNPYNNNLFLYCCYLEVLERLWTNIQPGLIVLESPGIALAIRKWAARKNISISFYNSGWMSPRSSAFFLFFLRWGNFLIISSFRWIAAYATKKMFGLKKFKHGSMILNTFVHDYSLSDDGIFKDRYFPHLHEFITGKGKSVVIHPVLAGFGYRYFTIYRKMRSSKTHFILDEDYLHFSDYLSAILYPLKILMQRTDAPLFRGFDISDVLKEERIENPINPALEAILIYRSLLRLGRSGLQTEMVIDCYENQVIDKGLIAGTRKVFPYARIIGAQMFIHSPNFISLFPSQSEFEAGIVPDILLETSRYQCQKVKAFTDRIPCRSAAALRYSHVFEESEKSQVKESKVILVLLPFSIGESLELLETLKDINPLISKDIRILIKGHPDYTSGELINAFGEKIWPHRFEIFRGSLPEALNKALVVISSNSSSMVEAATKGIPVIFLGRQTAMNYKILSDLKTGIVTECFSSSEIINAVEKYINLAPAEKERYKEIGKSIRDLFFEPVNEETLLPFLGIEKEQ